MKLLIRNICQPENTNPYGTGHGGWITTQIAHGGIYYCLLYTSPSPRDVEESRMPSSA